MAKAPKIIVDDAPEFVNGDEVDLLHALDQVAETPGAFVAIRRKIGAEWELVGRNALEGFDVEQFSVEHGAGVYELRFYRTGTRGMLAAPQRFRVGAEYGTGTKRTAAPPVPAESKSDDRTWQLMLTMMQQQHQAALQQAAQQNNLMIAMMTQKSSIDPLALVELLNKRTPASDLVETFKTFRELTDDGGEGGGLVESVIKAIPALAELAKHNGEQAPAPQRLPQRHLPPRPPAAPAPRPPSPEPAMPAAAPVVTAPDVSTATPEGELPEEARTVIASIVAVFINALNEQNRGGTPNPFSYAGKFVESFGADVVRKIIAGTTEGEIVEAAITMAPVLEPLREFMGKVEDILVEQYGEEDEDPEHAPPEPAPETSDGSD